MQLFAKLVHPEWGYECDKKQALELDMDGLYKVKYVEMGQSHTSIILDGFNGAFNSVQFDFYDEHYDQVDIYTSSEFNHYIR